ncbi:TIR domain-containing protein [Rhodovarius lipocyclicus]|uniref:TIR domain-containing protein n=1 Tax=Rhodovarius lipocyclicus TaxID=268410 RepID=UPI001359C643|nr:TIR domain-containing protein [Rhodovarius lipocyclicus]
MRWGGQVFLSYDSRDGSRLANLLRHELGRGSPQIDCSADLTTIDPDDALDEAATAIDRCACFLFLATPMSLQGDTPTKLEWKLAFDYKKPIVVIQAGESAPVGRLARRPRIRIGQDQTVSAEALRLLIVGTATSEGELQTVQGYLEDAREARARARHAS